MPAQRPPAPEPPSVLVNIQALRAFAALLVIFVHLKPLAKLGGLDPDVLNFGNAGVDVFFVISGVIMVFTVRRRETRPLDFLAHRIVRIAPFYWLVTLAVFAVALAAPHLVQSTRADLADLLRSLAFIPFVRPDGLMEPVVFVGWTLNYEMAFYLLFALTMLARPRSLSFALCIGTIAAAVALDAAMNFTDRVVGFYTYPIVLEFAAGVAIGWAAPRVKLPLWVVLPMGGLGALGVLIDHALLPDVDRVFALGLPAAAMVLSALLLERSRRRVGWRLPIRLGDASYSIYLTHFFIAQAAAKVAIALKLTQPAVLVGTGALALVGAAAAGLVVHAGVEAPLTRAVGRMVFGARRRAPSTAVGTEAV
jgi:exopolysaccharide production protein ExoZ